MSNVDEVMKEAAKEGIKEGMDSINSRLDALEKKNAELAQMYKEQIKNINNQLRMIGRQPKVTQQQIQKHTKECIEGQCKRIRKDIDTLQKQINEPKDDIDDSYMCPYGCGAQIDEGMTPCPGCGMMINWE